LCAGVVPSSKLFREQALEDVSQQQRLADVYADDQMHQLEDLETPKFGGLDRLMISCFRSEKFPGRFCVHRKLHAEAKCYLPMKRTRYLGPKPLRTEVEDLLPVSITKKSY
jgi:hypothetical protein